MKSGLTEVQRLLIELYWPKAQTSKEKNILTVLGIGAKFYGIEKEVLSFIKNHPDAEISELGDFLPPEEELEIIDDDELDDESSCLTKASGKERDFG